MKYVLSLDQGTTSSRAIIFDHAGAVRSVAQKEFKQYYPQDGWVEHNPKEIWSSQSSVAVEAVTEAGLSAKDLVAIGITNQRETTIVWDRRTGDPIYNAIVWQDRRTAPITKRLKEAGMEGLFREKTGLVLDPYFSGTKIQWILDNVEGARAKAEAGELAFGTVDTWLVYRFTEGRQHVTDASNASRTLLFNIHTGTWDDELLAALSVPRSMLPEVRSSSEVYGEVGGNTFMAGVPIAGIAGDQHAALFGQTCFKSGMAKNTYGTGCFLLTHTGDKPVTSKNNLLTTVAWRLGDKLEYALEGSVFIGGAVVQWLRDGLKMIRSAPESEALASRAKDNGGIYLVPAFSGLGAPHWDPFARGTLVGITRGTTDAHIARAALESIAFQSYDVLKAMNADSGIPLQELRVDGGASMNNLLMQFQADLLGVPVVRPKVTETTALGAAYLAGLAVGYWKDKEDIAHHWSVDRIFEPNRPSGDMASLHTAWLRALGRSKAWVEEN